MIGELGDRIATLVQDNLIEIGLSRNRAFYSTALPAFATDPRSRNVELIGARYAGRIVPVARLHPQCPRGRRVGPGHAGDPSWQAAR